MCLSVLSGDQGCPRCVKCILVTVHILCAIISAFIVFLAVYALFIADTDQFRDIYEEDPDLLNPRELKKIARPLAFLFSAMLFTEMIAVMGILRENKRTIIIYLALSVLSFIVNIIFDASLGVLHLVVIGMTAYYAYILHLTDQTVLSRNNMNFT